MTSRITILDKFFMISILFPGLGLFPILPVYIFLIPKIIQDIMLHLPDNRRYLIKSVYLFPLLPLLFSVIASELYNSNGFSELLKLSAWLLLFFLSLSTSKSYATAQLLFFSKSTIILYSSFLVLLFSSGILFNIGRKFIVAFSTDSSSICLILLISSIIYYCHSKIEFNLLLFFLCISPFIIYSGSKIGIYAFVIVFLRFVFLKYRFFKFSFDDSIFKLSLIPLFALLSVILLSISRPIDINVSFLTIIEQITSGRIYIWFASFDAWLDSPFFGHGLNTFSGELSKLYAVLLPMDSNFELGNVFTGSSHNTFMRILPEVGIFSFIFYLYFIINTFTHSFANKFVFLVVLIIFLMHFTLDLLYSPIQWFVFPLLVSSFTQKNT